MGIVTAWVFYFNPTKEFVHKNYGTLSDSLRWLPIPNLGDRSRFKNRRLTSFFKEKGKACFEEATLPLVKKYMPGYKVNLNIYRPKDIVSNELVYEDEYQIVVAGPVGSLL